MQHARVLIENNDFSIVFNAFSKNRIVFHCSLQVFASSRFDGSRLEQHPVDHSTWYRRYSSRLLASGTYYHLALGADLKVLRSFWRASAVLSTCSRSFWRA